MNSTRDRITPFQVEPSITDRTGAGGSGAAQPWGSLKSQVSSRLSGCCRMVMVPASGSSSSVSSPVGPFWVPSLASSPSRVVRSISRYRTAITVARPSPTEAPPPIRGRQVPSARSTSPAAGRVSGSAQSPAGRSQRR
jgi:hypothetical protein